MSWEGTTMRSKTSCFNSTLFWKNIRRFWPLWAGYLGVWFLILPLSVLSGNWGSRGVETVLRHTIYSTGIYGGVIIGAVMGVFSAMAMWGYLYSPRSAHGIACLPLRRECVFLTNLLAGFAPILAANAVIAALTKLAALGVGHAVPGAVTAWFALVTLIGFFFYCFATLCAQLTGHILVLPAVYAILNFVAAGAETLMRAICGVFVYGMNRDVGVLTLNWLSPVIGYFRAVQASYLYSSLTDTGYRYPVGVELHGWGTVVAYALAGLVLLVAAALLYRRRNMESAGDVVAVKPLKPVFRWCMALGAGMALSALLYEIIFNWDGSAYRTAAFLALLVFFLIGALLGWFAAEMLMKKTFRVFRARSWAGLGVCCLVIVLFMAGMRLDLFGYTRYVPATEKIASAQVIAAGTITEVEEPESIEQVRAFHQAVIGSKAYNESGPAHSVDCRINYTLKNGGKVSRYYVLRYEADGNGTLLPEDRGNASALNAVLNTPEGILNRKRSNIPLTRENLYAGSVNATMTAAECAAASGYDDAGEYILREHEGWSEARFAAADPEERRLAVAQNVLNESVNGYSLYWETLGVAQEDRYPIYTDYLAEAEQLANHLDLDKVYYDYSYNLDVDRAALWELYSECILPDLRDGYLGRVWAVTDQEYRNSVYQVSINLDFREKNKGQGSDSQNDNQIYDGYSYVPVPTASSDGYVYDSFYTVPTAGSFRTNAWLRAHGVPLYTQAETDVNRFIQ